MSRHCRHVGGQKQYIFSPLGNKIYFQAKLFHCFSPPTWLPWKPSIIKREPTKLFQWKIIVRATTAFYNMVWAKKKYTFRLARVAIQLKYSAKEDSWCSLWAMLAMLANLMWITESWRYFKETLSLVEFSNPAACRTKGILNSVVTISQSGRESFNQYCIPRAQTVSKCFANNFKAFATS